MTRKSAILITLILFLLIAGGGVVHYFRLRQQAATEFAEVDRFLRQIPESTQWKLSYTEYQLVRRDAKPAWVRWFGISRDEAVTDHTYWYKRKRPEVEDYGYFGVKRHRNRIEKVQVHFSSSCREEMKSLLLGKFPRFESRLDVIP